jgi:carbohydrate kinase (thermoresistant glucokinase family)
MVIILMGVSGSGKTTLGKRLAADLGWPFYEGDDFHSQANVEKMAQGEALTDNDRWPWLDALRTEIQTLLDQDRNAVMACSALKRVYRERLMNTHPDVHVVYLRGTYALIQQRIEARHGHFMPTKLLTSQFEALEEPEAPERAVVVDVAQPLEVLLREIRQALAV